MIKRVIKRTAWGMSVLLVGCGSVGPVTETPDERTARQGYEYNTRNGAQTYGYSSENGIRGRDTRLSSVNNIVYFDFDSAAVRPEARPIIENQARYLNRNTSLAVQLEGHSDERGTREYNIALGERRGHAVRRILVALGVTPNRITVVSFGEESPAAPGQDEYSYAQNRRVEIRY